MNAREETRHVKLSIERQFGSGLGAVAEACGAPNHLSLLEEESPA
jgi:hypothetical protein